MGDIIDFVWDCILGPKTCDCGQPLERDQAEIFMHQSKRGFAVKCPHCGRTYTVTASLERR